MIPMAERLAERRAVIAPDLPGFGQSEAVGKPLDIPELADVVMAWCQAMGLESAAFLGNSLGCQVVVDLALRYPGTVSQAILVSPTVDRVGRTMPEQFWRAVRDLMGEPWSLWPILARDYLDTGFRRLIRTLRFALADPVERKLAGVNCPTLVIRGDRDTIVPQRWVEEVVQLLPKGKLIVIPRGTHATQYSSPDELAVAIESFLSDHASSG